MLVSGHFPCAVIREYAHGEIISLPQPARRGRTVSQNVTMSEAREGASRALFAK